MTDRLPPSARARVGGRWAVSLRGYVVLCVLTVIGSVIGGGTVWGTAGVPGPPVLFIAAQCIGLGVILGVASVTVLRRRRTSPVSIWIVAAVGAICGPVRLAIGVAIRAAAGDAPIDYDLVLSSINTALVAAIAVPALAYALATRAWYTSERQRLIVRDVQIQAERLRASGAIDAARELLVQAVDAELAASRARATTLSASSAPDGDQMADLLMQTARESVRPLSHELWGEHQLAYPSVTWREVVACEARRHPLPILVPSLGFLVITGPVLLRSLGLAGALITAAVALVAIGVIFRLGRIAIARRRVSPVVVIALALVLTTAPIALVATGLFSASIMAFAPMAAVLLLLLIAGGAPAAANETADAVIAELQAMVAAREVEQLALEQEHDRIRRELARHLHGTLQPRLVNASHVVREAAGMGDAATLEVAMREAALALTPTEQETVGPSSLTQVMDAAQHDWSRLLDLTFDAPVGQPWTPCAPAVAEVIRESLANAVVHGHATEAAVQVREHEGGLVVTVTDNGAGPQHGAPGLGAHVLDAATAGQWTLQAGPGEGGSILRATIRS